MGAEMQDATLDEIRSRFSSLEVERTQREYRVFRPEDKGKGSIWIARQRDGYRVVTTGTAHSIDREIERISGKKPYDYPDRAHKWWKSLSDDAVERVFEALAKSG